MHNTTNAIYIDLAINNTVRFNIQYNYTINTHRYAVNV